MNEIKETLSSNCLFHFTNGADRLIGILKNNFKPRFCLEDLSMFGIGEGLDDSREMDELAIPMVCFCDIPLSKVKNHLSFYGNYGIGLTKEWGIRNGVSPILYLDKTSETTTALKKLTQSFTSTSIDYEPFLEIEQASLRFYRFCKPYEGKFWRNGDYLQGVRFYDEREWRYVPDIEPGKATVTPWMLKKQYLDDIIRSEANEVLADNYSLNFQPDDIKYIIVENEDQILSIIQAVERIKGKYDSDTLKRLTSRILTKQQIIEDF